jgi:hypothetical protein
LGLLSLICKDKERKKRGRKADPQLNQSNHRMWTALVCTDMNKMDQSKSKETTKGGEQNVQRSGGSVALTCFMRSHACSRLSALNTMVSPWGEGTW